MASIFDLFNPVAQNPVPRAEDDLLAAMRKGMALTEAEIEAGAASSNILSTAAQRQSARMTETHSRRAEAAVEQAKALMEGLRSAQSEGRISSDYAEYLRDAWERMILTVDTLRKRGDIFLEHEAAGCPPVLIYDYEVVMDGKDMDYPSNYMLLKIIPPEGVVPTSSSTRVQATAPALAGSNLTVRWAWRWPPVTRSTLLLSAASRSRGSSCPTSPAPRPPSCAR
jgi:hypothetical protein